MYRAEWHGGNAARDHSPSQLMNRGWEGRDEFSLRTGITTGHRALRCAAPRGPARRSSFAP